MYAQRKNEMSYVDINQDIRYIQPKLSVVVSNQKNEKNKESVSVSLTVERMKQRITIDELSTITKIPSHVIKDYESGKKIPICVHLVFRKTFGNKTMYSINIRIG